MEHNLLNNISGAMVLVAVTLAFCLLFEPRYPRKKYLASLLPFLAVLLGSNFYVIFRYGFAIYGKVCLLIATIPSCIYFFITSESRDGRYFFTFCLVDTVSIWFSLVTGMLDYLFRAGGLVNFFARILLCPLILYAVYRWGRRAYLGLLHSVKKGWWLLTATTAAVYILLIMVAAVPTSLRERPEDLPLAAVFSAFLLLVYVAIFYTLSIQKKLHDRDTLQNIFSAQASSMKARAGEICRAEKNLKIMRHDMRHGLNILEEFALKGEAQEALDYIGSTQRALDETSITHYCANPILDAVLSSYFRKAEESGIHVETHLHIPEELPVADIDLATVFGNALDNAILACSALPKKDRMLSCTCIIKPTLMLEVKNSFRGHVIFSPDGLPMATEDSHGIGSQSIAAFCKKYSAVYNYEATGNTFRLIITL